MKKQNAYTIVDEIFMDTLSTIYQYFKDIPYAIVGGGAVQIYTASVIAKENHVNTVKNIHNLSFMLRRTGDIDLSFQYDPIELTKTFNLIIEHASGNYQFHSFYKRFVIQQGQRRLNLNYQTEDSDLKGISPYYNDIIRTAITINLLHKNEEIGIKIAKPEYLIASKLTRIKPKDQIDIVMLLNAMEKDGYPFDSEDVRAILKSVQKQDNYPILIELMDSV